MPLASAGSCTHMYTHTGMYTHKKRNLSLSYLFETLSHSVALANLELPMVDQAGLGLTVICLPLPSEHWD